MRNPLLYSYRGPLDRPVACLVTARFNRDRRCQAILLSSYVDQVHEDLTSSLDGVVRDLAAYLIDLGAAVGPNCPGIAWYEHAPGASGTPQQFWRLTIDLRPQTVQAVRRETTTFEAVRDAVWHIPPPTRASDAAGKARGIALI
jgi:hypothetical protein